MTTCLLLIILPGIWLKVGRRRVVRLMWTIVMVANSNEARQELPEDFGLFATTFLIVSDVRLGDLSGGIACAAQIFVFDASLTVA